MSFPLKRHLYGRGHLSQHLQLRHPTQDPAVLAQSSRRVSLPIQLLYITHFTQSSQQFYKGSISHHFFSFFFKVNEKRKSQRGKLSRLGSQSYGLKSAQTHLPFPLHSQCLPAWCLRARTGHCLLDTRGHKGMRQAPRLQRAACVRSPQMKEQQSVRLSKAWTPSCSCAGCPLRRAS